MKQFVIILPWLCLMILALACGSAPPKGTLDAEDQFLIAKEGYDSRKFQDAQIEFQKLIWNYPGSEYIDQAQYYLAECLFHQEDYTGALIEYARLLRNYSKSPFAASAQYKVGLCYYEQSLPAPLDQEDTNNAIRELKIFLEEYPNSEHVPEAESVLLEARTKLAQKEYLNGVIYYKMDDYASAIIYMEEVLQDYSDTQWADDAQYIIGECLRDQQKWDQALAAYEKLLEMDVSDKLAHRAQKRIQQIEEKLGESSG